jgi:hypothetical protein
LIYFLITKKLYSSATLMNNLQTLQDLTINNNFSCAGNASLNTVVADSIMADSVTSQDLIVNGDSFLNYVSTLNDDMVQIAETILDINVTKADKKYVDDSINALLNADTNILQTIHDINTALTNEENSITSILSGLSTKANDNNTVHIDANETITGAKQFNNMVTLNGNVIADSKTVIPQKIGYISNLNADCQTQLNNINTNVSNLQVEQITITTSQTLLSSKRQNCQIILNPIAPISVTLPFSSACVGKMFFIINASNQTCTVLGNNVPMTIENLTGSCSTTNSILLSSGSCLQVTFAQSAYYCHWEKNLINTLKTLNDAVQSRAQQITSNGTNTVVTKSNIGADNASTFVVIDNPSSSSRSLSVFPNIASKSYTSLVEQSDILLLANNNFTIALNNGGQKSVGIRMTGDDLILSSSTASTSDNKIVMNATNKTMNFTSPNWIGFNNAVACPDVILNSYSLAQTLSNIITNAQMISYQPNSTVITKSINGASSTPTLELCDINSGNLFYFCPNVTGGAYNLMPHDNDALLIARYNLTIGPWTAKNVGIRMTDSDLTIGASTVVPLDNKIVLDATNKTINFVSPNWIAANNSICAPDFRLINTNESISDIIGALRTEDTVLSNQVSAARQETYDLSVRVDSNQTAANTAIAATNTSVANLTKIWAYARVFLNGSGSSATYTLLGYNNNITSVTRIVTGTCGIVITNGASSHWCATASSGQTSTKVMTGIRAGFPQFHWVVMMSGDDDFSFTLI